MVIISRVLAGLFLIMITIMMVKFYSYGYQLPIWIPLYLYVTLSLPLLNNLTIYKIRHLIFFVFVISIFAHAYIWFNLSGLANLADKHFFVINLPLFGLLIFRVLNDEKISVSK